MVTVVVATRPQVAALYLARLKGPVHCLIPVGTEQSWRAAVPETPVHAVPSWTDYTALAAATARLPVTRVVGTDEMTIAAAGYLRTLLGIPGQSWSQAIAFTDKATMKSALHAAGIPVAPWSVAHSLQDAVTIGDELGWPIVLKPRRGFGAVGTTRAYSPQHLFDLAAQGHFEGHDPLSDAERAFQTTGIYSGLLSSPNGFQVERCIDVAAEFTCDCVLWNGEPRLTLVTRYTDTVLDAVEQGGVCEFLTMPDGDPDTHAVTELTRRAMTALQLQTGQVHCEVFRTADGKHVLGEIACRAGGGALPALSELLFGVNTLSVGVDLGVGTEPKAAQPRAHAALGVVGIPFPAGIIEQAPTEEELELLPGVVRADVRVRTGDISGGGLGSVGAAAYLFIEPQPGQTVHTQMSMVRALAKPRFRIAPLDTELVKQ
ncbi:acetyl-CoA carboxylase biotin carboxylase subunit family protein [Nocardia sp. NPDC057668]|uniref:ATP-grasp domain-containing protein n=1 Tax=Nocardia sp. NPDC057668 TaxID=3346202 RepID=UPI00366E8D10